MRSTRKIDARSACRLTLPSLLLLIIGLYIYPCVARSQPTESRERLDDTWSVICDNSRASRSFNDCSIVGSVKSAEDRSLWVRAGFAFTSEAGDAQVVLRIPRLRYFSQGVVLQVDGMQLGQAFVDTCNDDFCESKLEIDSKIYYSLAEANVVSFVYQVGDAQSISIPMNFSQFHQGVLKLQQLTSVLNSKLFGPDVGDKALSVTFQLKSDPRKSLNHSYFSWGENLKDCHGAPARKTLEISTKSPEESSLELSGWLDTVKNCAKTSVVWAKSSEMLIGMSLKREEIKENIIRQVTDSGLKFAISSNDALVPSEFYDKK